MSCVMMFLSRVVSAMNHLTVIEVGEPVTTVAVGSPQSFKVERRPLALAGSQAPESRRESILAQVQKHLPGGKVNSIDWGTPKDLTKPSRLTMRAEDLPGTGTTDQSVNTTVNGIGERPLQLAALLSVMAAEKAAPEAKDRTQDYYLTGAFTAEDRMRVVPPDGFVLKQLPQVGDLSFGPLTIRRKVSLDSDGSVVFVYRLEGDRRVTPAQARSLLDAAELSQVHTQFTSYRKLHLGGGKHWLRTWAAG